MAATVYQKMLEVMTNRGGPYAGMDIPEFYRLVEAWNQGPAGKRHPGALKVW